MKHSSADDLRAKGWSVAVHNDYRVAGQAYTFWLMTHSSGRWLKGEGTTDAIALDQIREVLAKEAAKATAKEEARIAASKSCNLHTDCAAAEARAAAEGMPERFGPGTDRVTHCIIEDCEDCFGC